MSEVRVETAQLRAYGNTFDEAAAAVAPAATVDHAAVQADIAAFGEINAVIHEQYRAVRQAQADAWAAHQRADLEHADKVAATASGYDVTDGEGATMLGSTG